ncbi:hypothetical protein PTT_10039 [Pyrenophora teres f. teres 0-1]|uniref:Uncharacterized protein n=1 Tax=Pyrenophora teres f. teres (strain 0-1) TaxID=861557 RepID=E3RN99_PYRTT|nr:hypothetical protein PTT_10039 [Pyrenophora teres f. teres 0-1]
MDEKMQRIDVHDEAFHASEEYKNAISALYITHRSVPRIPGQRAAWNLLWNQVVGAAWSLAMANCRRLMGCVSSSKKSLN